MKIVKIIIIDQLPKKRGIMSQIKYVIKRSGTRVPFIKNRITNAIYQAAVAVGGRDKQTAENLMEQVVRKLEEKADEHYIPHIEEIQDIVEKILIKNGHSQVAKAYIIYREEQKQERKEKGKLASHPSANIPWSKIWRILDWAVDHDLDTIPKINARIKKGEFPTIVNESEIAYENDVSTAAELIIERSRDLKMVMVSGPSSSGKTTTTIKLETRLQKKGLKFKAWNVDNYFYDLEMHPKDEFGDYDFETPQALDLPMINEHLQLLCAGKEIKVPFYDFKTGTRHLDRSSMKLAENEILLIDSLHGLYPDFSKDIPNESKFKLYLEPLLQMKGENNRFIRWTDLRMIRRMLRDATHRAYKPRQTLEHWHYVRRSEKRNIIPYVNRADYIINSGMPYEIALYKARLFNDFKDWKDKYKDNPLRIDALERVSRIYDILNSVIGIEDDSPVPEDSVLREFIGGSSLKY